MRKLENAGLGEPVKEGKLALFQPPKEDVKDVNQVPIITQKDIIIEKQATQPRIRTTIDLTSDALIVLQKVQQQHRLKTGRSLPIWKALSLVITEYANSKAME